MQNLGIKIGLYRDDALAIGRMTNRQLDNVKKQICKIFSDVGLKIEIEVRIILIMTQSAG